MQGRTNFHPSRSLDYTKIVYGGSTAVPARLGEITRSFNPPPSPYRVFFGEIHGHTALSDGQGSPETYFRTARDVARLDFCALTDHDHGGVGRPELWDGKWDAIQDAVAAFHADGTFVVLLGYERDSFPWYPNLCLYYREGRGAMVRGVQDGELTQEELAALLARDDVLVIPHQISQIEVGVNFRAIPLPLMPRLVEIYSKWGASEFLGNPRPIRTAARGNYWQDALELGARVGCIAGSDVHSPYPGIPAACGHANLRRFQPGIAAVLATELTREAVFSAMRQRRCYACEGTRIKLDFRVNGATMGEEIADGGEPHRTLFFQVEAPAPIEQIAVIKNGRDQFLYHLEGEGNRHSALVIDLEAERPTDYYYLRVTQSDGLRAWSSPIWVEARRPR